MISYAQWYINAGTRDTLVTTPLVTSPRQMFYTITPLLTQCLRIEAVRQGGRDLKETTIRELCHVSTHWFRDTGPQFEMYALVGRDLLVVYPGVSIGVSLDVVQTKLTTVMSNDSVAYELRDDSALATLDLAEAFMSVKRRDYNVAMGVVQRMMPRAKPNDNKV
jgi:hypothetical protein